MPSRTERPVTLTTLGAWVLSCDPTVWDLEQFLEDGHRVAEAWSVRRSYRTDLMAPGQRVLLWVLGGSAAHPRGFWGAGWTTGSVSTEIEDDGYWIDEEKLRSVVHRVPIALTVFEAGRGVVAPEIKDHPVLRDFELFRVAQMSNPSWLSVEQLDALVPLLPPWPTYPGPADEVIAIGQHGATRGDPLTRRAVELAAMDTTRAFFESRGGHVTDVSKDYLGYDLLCTDSKGVDHHVEVKGVSGAEPKFLLTRHEFEVASADDSWHAAVLVNALDPIRRRLVFFARADVIAQAKPFVHQVDLSADRGMKGDR